MTDLHVPRNRSGTGLPRQTCRPSGIAAQLFLPFRQEVFRRRISLWEQYGRMTARFSPSMVGGLLPDRIVSSIIRARTPTTPYRSRYSTRDGIARTTWAAMNYMIVIESILALLRRAARSLCIVSLGQPIFLWRELRTDDVIKFYILRHSKIEGDVDQ